MGIEKELTEGVVNKMTERTFLERLIDMQVFFIKITGVEPTKVIIGHKQCRELSIEARAFFSAYNGDKFAGKLIGMDVILDNSDNRLEVTC